MKNVSQNINLKSNAAASKKFGIVKSLWNSEITEKLHKGCYDTLIKYGAHSDDITTLEVPGSFELIYGGKKIVEKSKLDAVILIGSIIKGETPHFDIISQSISHGVKDLNILFDTPFLFCVLTDLNMQQAMARSGGKEGNKGADCAIAAIQLIKNIA